MPYCSSALVANDPDLSHKLIAKVATECFRARDAYLLDNDSWNIDAGENDVRAINRNPDGVIQFFCRYADDIKRTETKIENFAREHGNDCRIVEIIKS